jgi:hypothetical protein
MMDERCDRIACMTSSPDPDCPEHGVPRLPRAKVHGVRRRWPTAFIGAAIAAVLGVTLGCISIGFVLGRIDRARATAEAARAEARLLRSQMDAAFVHRDLKPPNLVDVVARTGLELADRRIEVLRRIVYTLIVAGTSWSPDFKGMPSLDDTLWPALPERGWNLKCEPMRDTGPGALAKGEK